MSATPSATTAPDARAQFLALLADALQAGTLVKLVLARHVGVDQTLQRIIAKPLQVKGQDCLSLVYRHQTRDITRNLPLEQAQTLVAELLPESFAMPICSPPRARCSWVSAKGQTDAPAPHRATCP